MIAAIRHPRHSVRTNADARTIAPVWGLAVIAAASAVIRSIISWRHATPRYFPDEYIYAALSRSIGHGHLEVRNHPAHFPGLLEPILAAPIWRAFSVDTGYHLVQVENAIAASLVVIPVYILARDLGIRTWRAYLCCVFAVVVPMLVMIPYVVSDFIAYPLVLAAVASAVRALDRPSPRRQAWFIGFALLAMFARVQFVVLVPAYLVAAVLIGRKRFLKSNKATMIVLSLAGVGAVVAATTYYRGFRHELTNEAILTWIPLQAFLLSLVAGVVLVPGAVAGLIRPGGSKRTAFAMFAGSLGILLLVETSVIAADAGYFKERYLFELLPLVAIAFCVYLERERPHRWVVWGTSAAIIVAAARLPMSAYAPSGPTHDPQSIVAVAWLQHQLTPASSSLIIAAVATVAALWSIAIAVRATAFPALPFAILVAILATVAATLDDNMNTSRTRAALPADLSWVDRSAKGSVTAIATPISNRLQLQTVLFWNPSIERELLLTTAIPTDVYATDFLHIARDGSLVGVDGDFLFDDTGSRATFSGARLVREVQGYALWRTTTRSRFRWLVEGYLPDNWLLPFGRIRAWSLRGPDAPVTALLALSLPADHGTAKIELAKRWFTVRTGHTVHVSCSGRGVADIPYRSPSAVLDRSLRPLTVQLNRIRVLDRSAPGSRGVQTRCRLAA